VGRLEVGSSGEPSPNSPNIHYSNAKFSPLLESLTDRAYSICLLNLDLRSNSLLDFATVSELFERRYHYGRSAHSENRFVAGG
jgi:hypothetical protein